ncbi:unnamed protein product [Didymodactylos carnosus]|uniref:Uncharacterized protein n=1 Tax=Didymodactylos carnosus TaxID=1234261 RepID=A0A8S2E2R5_9BILA|nr:unnamed protein product [Didymodactylos carnosus]CAF3871346.1 unnamed protein product [Didymodactylos carnosus]CAF4412271.1 unnamed protein product [Didymodactylos carnosus]
MLSEDHQKLIDEINNKKLFLNKLKIRMTSNLDNYTLVEKWKQMKLDKLDKIYNDKTNQIESYYNSNEFDKLNMKCMDDIGKTLQRASTMKSKDLKEFIIEINQSIVQLELLIQHNDLNKIEQNNDIKHRIENSLNNNNYIETVFNSNFVRFRQIAASHEHILIDNGSQLLLFNKTGSKTVITWNMQQNGFIRSMVWSHHMKKFIVLGVDRLFTFDHSTMIIEEINYFPLLNFITIYNQDIFMNFKKGEHIEHWIIGEKWKFVQSWTKKYLGYENTDVIYKMSISGARVAMNSGNKEGHFVLDIFDVSSMGWLYRVNNNDYSIRLLTSMDNDKWLCIDDETKRFYCTVNNNLLEIKYDRNVIHNLYQVALLNETHFAILGYERENEAKLLLYNITN